MQSEFELPALGETGEHSLAAWECRRHIRGSCRSLQSNSVRCNYQTPANQVGETAETCSKSDMTAWLNGWSIPKP